MDKQTTTKLTKVEYYNETFNDQVEKLEEAILNNRRERSFYILGILRVLNEESGKKPENQVRYDSMKRLMEKAFNFDFEDDTKRYH
ncbi:hypothetical protein [Priestia megaterium]|uniref:hypothetical protein n=1 Tax=Priestia megaterium TaxID=1404 RepID=UPI0021D647CE|nr:hypothetical protein [Priestia megaterium]MCU7766487.1 hypothetical protein [Priestia megaterium]